MKTLSTMLWILIGVLSAAWWAGHDEIPMPQPSVNRDSQARYSGAPLVADEPSPAREDDLGYVTVFSEPGSVNTVSQRGPLKAVATPAATKQTVIKQRLSSQNGSEGPFDQGWKIAFQSTEERPIYTRTLGTGSTKILILAGLDGTDRAAVKWIDRLGSTMLSQPEKYAAVQVTLVRAVNPDGLLKKQVGNTRGVEINRNFPVKEKRQLAQGAAGPFPTSEVETRAVMQLIAQTAPHRVLLLQSQAGDTSDCWYGKTCEGLARKLEVEHRWSARQFDAEKMPGSLDAYADEVLACEFMRLSVGVGSDWQQVVADQQHAFQLALTSAPAWSGNNGNMAKTSQTPLWEPFGGLEQDLVTSLEGDAGPAEQPMPVSQKTMKPVSQPAKKGYEELPPPPGMGR